MTAIEEVVSGRETFTYCLRDEIYEVFAQHYNKEYWEGKYPSSLIDTIKMQRTYNVNLEAWTVSKEKSILHLKRFCRDTAKIEQMTCEQHAAYALAEALKQQPGAWWYLVQQLSQIQLTHEDTRRHHTVQSVIGHIQKMNEGAMPDKEQARYYIYLAVEKSMLPPKPDPYMGDDDDAKNKYG